MPCFLRILPAILLLRVINNKITGRQTGGRQRERERERETCEHKEPSGTKEKSHLRLPQTLQPLVTPSTIQSADTPHYGRIVCHPLEKFHSFLSKTSSHLPHKTHTPGDPSPHWLCLLSVQIPCLLDGDWKHERANIKATKKVVFK